MNVSLSVGMFPAILMLLAYKGKLDLSVKHVYLATKTIFLFPQCRPS